MLTTPSTDPDERSLAHPVLISSPAHQAFSNSVTSWEGSPVKLRRSGATSESGSLVIHVRLGPSQVNLAEESRGSQVLSCRSLLPNFYPLITSDLLASFRKIRLKPQLPTRQKMARLGPILGVGSIESRFHRARDHNVRPKC